MFKKRDLNLEKRLDRAGRRIVEASVLSDLEAADIASSPFIYAALRGRIARQRENSEFGSIWSGLDLAGHRAIPAMALAAAISFGLFLYVNGNRTANQAFSVDAYLGTNDSGIDNLLFAERRSLTGEEVLTTIVGRDDREAAK